MISRPAPLDPLAPRLPLSAVPPFGCVWTELEDTSSSAQPSCSGASPDLLTTTSNNTDNSATNSSSGNSTKCGNSRQNRAVVGHQQNLHRQQQQQLLVQNPLQLQHSNPLQLRAVEQIGRVPFPYPPPPNLPLPSFPPSPAAVPAQLLLLNTRQPCTDFSATNSNSSASAQNPHLGFASAFTSSLTNSTGIGNYGDSSPSSLYENLSSIFDSQRECGPESSSGGDSSSGIDQRSSSEPQPR